MKVSGIFTTLDGEVTHEGPLQWSVFVRLGGCHIRCWKSSGYCDAPHALDMDHPYPSMSVQEVHRKIATAGPKRVTITGGEPLLQMDEVTYLARLLRATDFEINLETSGTIDFHRGNQLGAFGCVIMDLKPPSSEMVKKNVYENLARLWRRDYVKVVISNLADLDWLRETLYKYPTRANIAVGPRMVFDPQFVTKLPAHPVVLPRIIVKYMQDHGLWRWRLNLQLHKYIWPEAVKSEVDSLVDLNYADYEGGEV